MYYFCISFIILPKTSKVPLFGVDTSIFFAKLKLVDGLGVEFVVAIVVVGGANLVGVVVTVVDVVTAAVGDVGRAILRGKFLFLS